MIILLSFPIFPRVSLSPIAHLDLMYFVIFTLVPSVEPSSRHDDVIMSWWHHDVVGSWTSVGRPKYQQLWWSQSSFFILFLLKCCVTWDIRIQIKTKVFNLCFKFLIYSAELLLRVSQKNFTLLGKPNFRHFVLGNYQSARPQTLAARSPHVRSNWLVVSEYEVPKVWFPQEC